jgi:hypothetical protein
MRKGCGLIDGMIASQSIGQFFSDACVGREVNDEKRSDNPHNEADDQACYDGTSHRAEVYGDATPIGMQIECVNFASMRAFGSAKRSSGKWAPLFLNQRLRTAATSAGSLQLVRSVNELNLMTMASFRPAGQPRDHLRSQVPAAYRERQ